MVVRIAGNRCIDEIGAPLGPSAERALGGGVTNDHPPHRIGPSSPHALAGKAEVGCSVTHGGVMRRDTFFIAAASLVWWQTRRRGGRLFW